ncbi:MAG: hypothetical protein K0S76_2790 [Herbinix sp.]|jgi:hypothetical protein|nr:hypothetical protein [Herbinix sp.]
MLLTDMLQLVNGYCLIIPLLDNSFIDLKLTLRYILVIVRMLESIFMKEGLIWNIDHM